MKGVKDCSGIPPRFEEEVNNKVNRWFEQQENECDAMSMELESGSDLDKGETPRLDDGFSECSASRDKSGSLTCSQEGGVTHSSSDDGPDFTGDSDNGKQLTMSSQGRTHVR